MTVRVSLFLLASLSSLLPVGTELSGQHAVLLPARFSTSFLSQGPSRPESGLAKGRFLVASRHLGDPNFSKTVILLIDYNQNGAIGVVINRPTEVQVSTLLPDIQGLKKRNDLVYLGGPVATNQMLLLVRSTSQPEGSLNVFEDVYTIPSQTVFQQMIDTGARFRAYVGYAGWAPSQLDFEVSRGDWYIVQADPATVFDKAASEIWPELIQRSEVQWASNK
jgi:putative transcriptional regulator